MKFKTGYRKGRYVFVLPCLIILIALVIYPLLFLIRLSFSVQDLTTGEIKFAGLVNYLRMLEDSRLVNGIRVTTLYTVGVIILQCITGLIFGLVITGLHAKVQRPVMLLCITPVLIAPILSGFMWSQMLDTTFGVVNYMLMRVGLISSMSDIRWTLDPILGIVTLIVVDSWQWTPFMGLICTAGLLSIPEDLLEAAQIDALTKWQKFKHVTWFYLRPVILVGLLFRAVDTARSLDLLYTLTRATPAGSTEALAYYIYRTGFEYFDMGYAAALSWILIALVSILTNILVKVISWGEVK